MYTPREANKVAHSLLRLSKDIEVDLVWVEEYTDIIASLFTKDLYNLSSG